MCGPQLHLSSTLSTPIVVSDAHAHLLHPVCTCGQIKPCSSDNLEPENLAGIKKNMADWPQPVFRC